MNLEGMDILSAKEFTLDKNFVTNNFYTYWAGIERVDVY